MVLLKVLMVFVKQCKGDLMKRLFLQQFVSITVICIAIGMTAPEIINASILPPGTEAPSFSMPSLSGKRESLRVWCGKKLSKPYVNNTPHIVIVSFWATYCKPCHKEIPELEKFYTKHKDKNIKIFLISIDSKGAGIVVPFAKERNYTLPILFDPYKKTAQRYGVKSLPALFVIGPDGIIRYSSTGYKEDAPIRATLENVVGAIKEGKEVTVETGGEKGETVEVRDGKKDRTPPEITPKQKWSAVARIECGTSPDIIAAELDVPKDEIRKWYNELKKLAIDHWASQ
jgi:peroxiredoxin